MTEATGERPPTMTGPVAVEDQARPARHGRNLLVSNEPKLRDAAERFARPRWPDARICHELVMNRGATRLDMAIVQPDRLITFEIKSDSDSMERAIHQLGVALLASDEVWLIADNRYNGQDFRAIRYLLPQIGLARGVPRGRVHYGEPQEYDVEVVAEAATDWRPYPQFNAALLWVSELCVALGFPACTKGSTHAKLVARLAQLQEDERRALVCRELRRRHALWRADPPVASAQ